MAQKPLTPPTVKSDLITPQGYQKLQDELDYLWRVKRPEVTRSVSEAAAQGDRSENAEYIYGKKLLRELDRRIRFLQKRIPELTAVDRKPDNINKVYFGAWVTLEDDSQKTLQVRIVGSDEIDPCANVISIDAPMAKALLGKSIDDEVTVALPSGGTSMYWVTSIAYDTNLV